VGTYSEFINSKRKPLQLCGFDPVGDLNKHLFDWQAVIVEWSLKRGRAALFEECGLGKTLQQLSWAEQVVKKTNKPVVLHCPVGVRQQTKSESEKFGIGVDVRIANEQSDIVIGINLVNYEKLHHFDPSTFAGVVLDESSILKNYTGKIKRQLVESYAKTRYRLACTATPSPNDRMELGNHSDFLGIMPSNEMLSRWFINDTMKAGGYRLKKHGEKDFWRWVSSWAVCVGKPSDIGGADNGFVLPELHINRHVVTADKHVAPNGMLFNTSGLSATNIHEEKRLTCESRTRKAAEIVNDEDSIFIVWCDTNYEADSLLQKLPNSVEIRGTDSEKKKEQVFLDFAAGKIKTLITKPSVAGFGMNWQHCNRQIFAGLSYSFESYYQAVRRCWRFGQDKPVTVDIILSDSESAIESAIATKESDHFLMQSGMADAMRQANLKDFGGDLSLVKHSESVEIELPNFLKRKEVKC
jgi:superfamily II DNA or RNA helicase